MNEFIERSIQHLTIQDLKKAATKYNISCTDTELSMVYQFLEEHYHELLQQDITVFEYLRPKISLNLYKKLLNLYIDLKQKYLKKETN